MTDGLWQTLDAGAERLRGLSLSRPADSFNKAVLKLFRERDPSQTLDAIEKVTLELGQIADILQETYQNSKEAEQAEAAAEPFGAAWMNALRRGSAYLTGVLPGRLRTRAQPEPGWPLRRPGYRPHPDYRP